MTAGNVESVLLGACEIVWGTSLIGATIGGVEMRMITQTKPIDADQSGTTTLNEFIIGRNVVMKLNMAETTADKLYLILANAGATQPNGPDTGVWVQTFTGLSLMPDAAPMLLRPINAPDGSLDMYLPAVAYTGDIKWSYKPDLPRSFDLNFLGYADAAHKLFYYGSSPQAQTMGGYITDGNHFNVIDPVIGSRDWSFVKDSTWGEIAFR